MGRLAIEPTTDEAQKELDDSGNGSSTFDVCKECEHMLLGTDYETALSYCPDPDRLAQYNGESFPASHYEVYIGVEHPCYGDQDYECAVCGKPLTAADNS